MNIVRSTSKVVDIKTPPLVSGVFRPAAKKPPCPPHLAGEARKEWGRITTELHENHMIALVDRGELAMLCTAWARYVEAEEMIKAAAKNGGSGLFVKTPNGFAVQSPWLAVSNSAMAAYKSLAADFGLSPFARSRVNPSSAQLSLFGPVENQASSAMVGMIDRPGR